MMPPDPYTRVALYTILGMVTVDLGIFRALNWNWVFVAVVTLIVLIGYDPRRHGIKSVADIPPQWNTRGNRRLFWAGSAISVLSAVAVMWKYWAEARRGEIALDCPGG